MNHLHTESSFSYEDVKKQKEQEIRYQKDKEFFEEQIRPFGDYFFQDLVYQIAHINGYGITKQEDIDAVREKVAEYFPLELENHMRNTVFEIHVETFSRKLHGLYKQLWELYEQGNWCAGEAADRVEIVRLMYALLHEAKSTEEKVLDPEAIAYPSALSALQGKIKATMREQSSTIQGMVNSIVLNASNTQKRIHTVSLTHQLQILQAALDSVEAVQDIFQPVKQYPANPTEERSLILTHVPQYSGICFSKESLQELREALTVQLLEYTKATVHADIERIV